MKSTIFLIGYRGSGKTTVAAELAERLGCESIDTDSRIAARSRKSIATIFAEDGEVAFRDLESEVIAQLSQHLPAVVALGGGAVLREANRQKIAAGTVVWLTASIDTLASRLSADPATGANRPDLMPGGGQAEIEAVLAERTPIYRGCATFELNTEGRTPSEIAEEIISRLPTA